jgi:hypothetical protein
MACKRNRANDKRQVAEKLIRKFDTAGNIVSGPQNHGRQNYFSAAIDLSNATTDGF